MANTVSIFLASSSELRQERLLIGNRVRMLNDEWEPRGVRIALNIWEDYAPEFTGERKQTEYNLNLVDKSNIVFGLFRKLCGKYSQEEVLRAYRNNPDSLHCFRLPADDDTAVGSFENASGIAMDAVADIEDVWQKMKSTTVDYIKSHYALTDAAIPLKKENVYATIGADLRTEEDELGNMIRGVDMLAEQTMGMRCRLLPMTDCQYIGESDYYMALLNNVLDNQSRDEFVTAYSGKKGYNHPAAIAPFQKKDGMVTRYDADNEVSRLMHSNGKEFFPVEYESLDTVKMTLVAYLLRKKQVLSPDVAFAMGDNRDLYFGGRRIADTGKALGLKTEMITEFTVHVELLELMMPTVPKLGMEASLRRDISDLLYKSPSSNISFCKITWSLVFSFPLIIILDIYFRSPSSMSYRTFIFFVLISVSNFGSTSTAEIPCLLISFSIVVVSTDTNVSLKFFPALHFGFLLRSSLLMRFTFDFIEIFPNLNRSPS